MAYTLVKVGKQYNYDIMEFFCDSDDDVISLPNSKNKKTPTKAGSKAKIANGNIYVLNSIDEWVKQPNMNISADSIISAQVEKTFDGAKITIEDSKGTTTATVTNGINGIAGISGVPGRGIEIRKGESAIEWKASNNVSAQLQFNSGGVCIDVNEDDIVNELRLVGYTKATKYVQIKVVTICAADSSGKEIVNANCSSSAPSNVKFEFLGGFDPKSEILSLETGSVIKGNMEIARVQKEGMEFFKGIPDYNKIAKINKIRLWVSFLDNKKEIVGKEMLVDFNINDSKESKGITEWNPIVALDEIKGKQGDIGATIKNIVLNKKTTGEIVGGTATLTNNTQVPITVRTVE